MNRISRMDLRDILEMVKHKIRCNARTACGLFWADTLEGDGSEETDTQENDVRINSLYSVQEPQEVIITRYSISD